MKKIFLFLTSFAASAAMLAGCAGEDNTVHWSKELFNQNGIYAAYDDLSGEEKENLLAQAQQEGYTIGLSEDGRITLTKDDEILTLGRRADTTDKSAEELTGAETEIQE